MKKSRFIEVQIVGILKELDAGTPATELGGAMAFTRTRSGGGKKSMPASRRVTWRGFMLTQFRGAIRFGNQVA